MLIFCLKSQNKIQLLILALNYENMLRPLLSVILLFVSVNLFGQCSILHVTSTGTPTGSGSQSSPIDLVTAFSIAGPGDLVRIASGNYTISSPLSIPANNVIFEGGFLPASNWQKSSLVGQTTITRTSGNLEGSVNQQRLVAIYGNGKSGFELHDLTITTLSATGNGTSNYTLHLSGCSNYSIVRCRILAGSGSAGANGIAGSAGANGSAGFGGGGGSIDNECSGAVGGTGGAGAGVGGGASVPGGVNPAGCTQNGGNGNNGNASANIRAGGSGGSGGAGGEEAHNGGIGGQGGGVNGGTGQASGGGAGTWGNPGNSGGNGSAGIAGIAGTIGANGLPGTVGLYYTPIQAGNGTDGSGGKGGCGGGGGGGQYCTFCIDGSGNGGGGGGGGGQGGTGGFGGFGGGGSFGIYLFNNGVNGNVIDCQVVTSSGGNGGTGGTGGQGGVGGSGGLGGSVGTNEIGKGGNGGNGGNGGAGGNGGSGASGISVAIQFVSGSPLVTSISNFNLLNQPEIIVDYAKCSNTSINFNAPSVASASWDFGANSSNQFSAQNPTAVAFVNTGNQTIIQSGNVYAQFLLLTCQGYNQTVSTTVCSGDSVSVGSNTYSVSGIYTDVFAAFTGCDSTIVTNLTVMPPLASTITQTSCDSFTWNGQTYNQSGVYYEVLTGSMGCDSTVTLQLTVNPSVTNTISETACDFYDWNGQIYSQSGVYSQTLATSAGCDSTVTLNLTVNPNVIYSVNETACDSYNWNGQIYTQSGLYSQVFSSSSGCDSTVNLQLTINSVVASIIQNGVNLTANPSAGQYQWIDCDDPNNTLSNSTAQNYLATQNGNFAVIVTVNNCSDTSACVAVSNVGVFDLANESINIYPNPFSDKINIDFGKTIEHATVYLYDVFGKIKLSHVIDHTKTIEFGLEVATGIYFVEIICSNGSKLVKRLVKD